MRAALLLRKSRIVAEGVDAISIAAQEARGRQWAQHHDAEIVAVYRENITGYKDVPRPEMQRALDDMLAGKFDVLWCFALDRLTRRGALAVAEILARGGRIIFDWDRLDSADPRDLRLILWRAEDAKEYSDLLSERVRGAKRHQRETGAAVGAPPLGMTYADKTTRKLTWAPGWREIIEGVFRDAASGKGMSAIARELNERGYRTRRGNYLYAESIRKIIHNPTYEGYQSVRDQRGNPILYLNANGQPVRIAAGDFQPIDPALVQAARARQQQRHAFPTSPTQTHILTGGVARCGGCGGPMHPAGTIKTPNARFYNCSRHQHGQPCDAPARMRVHLVDPYVTDRLLSALSALDPQDPEDQPHIAEIAHRWIHQQQPQHSAEADAAARVMAEARRNMERLIADRDAGIYDGPMRDQFLTRFRQFQAAYESARQRHEELSGLTPLDVSWMFEPDALRETWDAADIPTRRRIVAAAIRRVVIHKAPCRGYRGPVSRRVEIDFAWGGDGKRVNVTK